MDNWLSCSNRTFMELKFFNFIVITKHYMF